MTLFYLRRNPLIVQKLRFLLAMVLIPLLSVSQKFDKAFQNNLNRHLTMLASDSFEGRRSGTNGEKLAGSYVSNYFKSLKLTSLKNDEQFHQTFIINDGEKLDPSSSFIIDQQKFDIEKYLYFLPFSSKQAQIKAELYPSLKEKDGIWLVNIKESYNKPIHPHTDIISDLKDIALTAYKNGCKLLLFYNVHESLENSFRKQSFVEDIGFPVIYIRPELNKLFEDHQSTHSVQLTYKFYKSTRESSNVIGFLNNNRDTTIIIGAHYDHLGYGEDGNSMIRNGSPQIHNGADDNASGTSALLEIARYFTVNRKKTNQYNYIFAAFSGEELGLLGSKFMAEGMASYTKHVKFMINLDMVGRFNATTKSITIGGYGTSPDWNPIFSKINMKDFIVKFDSSGTGPSDHTSFYRKNIPVLFYFTGLHQDYHKPSDDSDKINYAGMVMISRNIVDVIKASKVFSVPFTKTREIQTSTNTRFSVSLGIMPDYSYNDGGVRIDGTSEGKIAQIIGLKAGDIILRIGNFMITSVESYMQALSKYKKGDATELEVKRGSEKFKKSITF